MFKNCLEILVFVLSCLLAWHVCNWLIDPYIVGLFRDIFESLLFYAHGM